jgi:hypothetical protein
VVADGSRAAGNPGTLGMTILFGNAKYSFQDELSSRPERSEVEGSAVQSSDFPIVESYRDEALFRWTEAGGSHQTPHG